MKKNILFLLLACSWNCIFAQTYIEPFVGYQKDVNGNKYNFSMINTGAQIAWKKGRTYELLLNATAGIGMSKSFSEMVYTSNPNLPVQSVATKTIHPFTGTFSLGHRFVLTGDKFNGSINALLYTGLSYQKIKVSYEYDKTNYTILNPDRTQDGFGFMVLAGVEYLKTFKNGRWFLQALAGPQPIMKKVPSNISFHFMAPLSFNTGYSFIIKKSIKRGR